MYRVVEGKKELLIKLISGVRTMTVRVERTVGTRIFSTKFQVDKVPISLIIDTIDLSFPTRSIYARFE